MGSDDWEATWDARLAALPADEEKYGWYAKLGEIVELNESAGDEAADPDLYENVKKGLTGGEGHAAIVRDYGPRSRQIAAAIKNLTETSGRAAVQKAEMKSLKLDDLLVAAEAALPIYGELLQTVCDDIATQHPVEFLKCPKVKAKARAANKVVIKYGGDCSHVKDLVRGTFIFESLEGMYAGIEALVFHPIFNGHAQCIMDFDDRWQEPLSGGYSDCQLLVNIMGHLCELQVNVREMISAKEGGGHVAYDVYRFVNEYLPVRKSTSASGRPGGITYYSGRLDAARECLVSSHEAS